MLSSACIIFHWAAFRGKLSEQDSGWLYAAAHETRLWPMFPKLSDGPTPIFGILSKCEIEVFVGSVSFYDVRDSCDSET